MGWIEKSLFCAAPILCVLLTSACTPPSNPSLGEKLVLSGQIAGWSRGSDYTLRATVTPGPSQPLTMAPIDAAGNFSITLPDAVAVTPYLILQHVSPNQPIPGCSGNNLDVRPTDFATTLLQLSAASGTSVVNVSLAGPPGSGSTVSYVYFDRNFDETGTVSCTAGSTSFEERIDIHFGAGWNAEVVTRAGNMYSVTSGPIPEGMSWQTPQT